jgi:uncharacterized membrane protein YciS (DUF1049 family)
MKNLVFVLMIVLVALAFGQSSMKSQQEVMNYNYNWGRLKSDTLRVTTVIDTVVLTAKAYNVLIWPID